MQVEIAILRRFRGRQVCSITLPADSGIILLKRMARRYDLERLDSRWPWDQRYSGKAGTANFEYVLVFRTIERPKMSHFEARASELLELPPRGRASA